MKYFFSICLILVSIFATSTEAADNTDIHENAGTRAMTFLKIGDRRKGNRNGRISCCSR